MDRRRKRYRPLSESGRPVSGTDARRRGELPAAAGYRQRDSYHRLLRGRDGVAPRVLRQRSSTGAGLSLHGRQTRRVHRDPETCRCAQRASYRHTATCFRPQANWTTAWNTRPACRWSAPAGRITATEGALRIEKADALTIFVAAGTNYLPDRARAWRGESPHARIERQLRAAAAKPYAELRAAHIADYQALFRRVSLNLGTKRRPTCRPTSAWCAIARARPIRNWRRLFFQFGRYLLISSSRPGSLPANLQGLWNNSNNPPWRSDYHSNINIQMNYWPAEVTNLSECAIALFRLRQQPARRAHRGHAPTLSERARLDGADREQHLWRGQFQVESARVRLVRTALLGALRLHPR